MKALDFHRNWFHIFNEKLETIQFLKISPQAVVEEESKSGKNRKRGHGLTSLQELPEPVNTVRSGDAPDHSLDTF